MITNILVGGSKRFSLIISKLIVGYTLCFNLNRLFWLFKYTTFIISLDISYISIHSKTVYLKKLE